MADTTRKFAVYLTVAPSVNVTAAQVQAAILRAANTKAFGIPGTLTVDMIRVIEEPSETSGCLR
jgi:hypothetical protein